MTLPTFKPDATCPKCNHDTISVSYIADNEHACQYVYAPPAYGGAGPVCHYHRGEHLHRTCARCHYRWAEAVVSPHAFAAVPSETE